jgi:hypothetical protein
MQNHMIKGYKHLTSVCINIDYDDSEYLCHDNRIYDPDLMKQYLHKY